MFAVPIDQSGLSSFVPVRRQSGSSVGLQNLGFNVFGQPIETLPSLSDRRNLAANQALDIGGTDIGQIKQTGLASFVPLDSNRELGFDEEEGPQPTGSQSTEPQGTINQSSDINFSDLNLPSLPSLQEIGDKIEDKIDDIFTMPSYTQDKEGIYDPLGTVTFAGKNVNIAEEGFKAVSKTGLTSILGRNAPVFGPILDLASKAIFSEKDLEPVDFVATAGKVAASAIFGPIGLLVTSLIEMGYDFFFGDEPIDSPSAPDADDPDPAGTATATEGIGVNIDKDIDEYGDFGKGPDVSGGIPGSPGFGGYGDMGQMGGPTGSGMGDDDGDADGDDDGADGDADACWVAGTQVLMGDCTYRNIEDLKIGDVVMSFPEDKKTRKWTTELEAKPIISLSVNRSRNIWHLNDTMVTGREWIVKGDGTAALVMWLQEGDTVMGADGEPINIYRVEAAEGPLSSQITYTFETQNNFSYTADNFRTLRGRAVRAPEDWVYAKDVPTGSMQDEYNKKFSKLAA